MIKNQAWVEPHQPTVSTILIEAAGHPIVAAILARRGLSDPQRIRAFLDPAAYAPAPPDDLPDMARAVERVERALAGGESILIWGDFDVDGQTASALLVEALRGLGGDPAYYIPHRQNEGHGVQVGKLAQLLEARPVKLLITCDTGISAHEAVEFANGRGVEVVITDHHQLPPELPPAYAAVNPQRLPSGHPLRGLPGVGAAYKLIEALYQRAGRADELERLLDLVALGIVADVAVQTGDTRYLLQRGLRVLRQTERPGLRALLKLAKIAPEKVDEQTIGFVIAPRMNALGRLSDANAAVEFLITTDELRAEQLAATLEGLNTERKLQTEQVYSAARGQITADESLLASPVLVVAHEGWPGGIIGLVANRLAEEFSRPVILLSLGADGIAKGSARSVAGVDITAAIASQSDLLEHYGGHTMAAGLAVRVENLPALRRGLAGAVAAQRGQQADSAPPLEVDAIVALSAVDAGLEQALRMLAPFGMGNPAPVIAVRRLTLDKVSKLDRDGKHLALRVYDEAGASQEVIWWNGDAAALPKGRLDVAFTLRESEYKEQRRLQCVLVDFRPTPEAPRSFAERTLDPQQIIDFRDRALGDQIAEVIELDDREIVVWNEGEAVPGIKGARRQDLKRAAALVIWTAPPSRAVLQAALERVNPERIILIGVNPPTAELQAFKSQLGGLVKYALNHKNGLAALDDLGGALGHHRVTVRAGLEYLAARGHIRLTHREGDRFTIERGGAVGDERLASERLAELLRETVSYRSYFRRADKLRLLELDAS